MKVIIAPLIHFGVAAMKVIIAPLIYFHGGGHERSSLVPFPYISRRQ